MKRALGCLNRDQGRRVLGLTLCSLVVGLLPVGSALAATVIDDRPFLYSFDGSDSTAGRFTHPRAIAVDNSSGSIYVLNVAGTGKGPGPFDSQRVIDKFDFEGNATVFSAIGESSLDGSSTPGGAFGVLGFFETNSPYADIAVDNSGLHPGRIYVSEEAGPIHAFGPEGAYLWTFSGSEVTPCGIEVDGQGYLWVVDQGDRRAVKYDTTAVGAPPLPPADEVPLPKGGGSPCRLAIDSSGDHLYVSDVRGNPSALGIQKYSFGEFQLELTPRIGGEIAVDQSDPAGHVFAIVGGRFLVDTSGVSAAPPVSPFVEFDASGIEVSGSPFGRDLIGDGAGIGHYQNRIYVADLASNTVKVFGPLATGTAPDATSGKSNEITRTEATAHGTINPQNVPNAYRFEWARGGNEVQRLEVNAGSGTFRLRTGERCCAEASVPLPADVSPEALQDAFESLDSVGAGNVSVSGTPANVAADGDFARGEYTIVFIGDLAGVDVGQVLAEDIDLEGAGGDFAFIATASPGPSWPTAQSSPRETIEPTDSSSHAVSYRLMELKQNATYSVRLVGTNKESGLSTYSKPDIFTTQRPPPPVVEGCNVSAVEVESAEVACTVDPEGDETTWQILVKAQAHATVAECVDVLTSEFKVAKTGKIATEETGNVDVATNLMSLEPAQSYCVRVISTNSGGNDSEDLAFRTDVIPPSEASIASAAPRTDTGARVNAYVNPNGEAEVTYRFEWSSDGSVWTQLPIRKVSAASHDPIMIADELGELEPATTYYYRLASVENEAGAALPPGEEKTVTTRTSAEVTLPAPRAIELINNPDKGNQNVAADGGDVEGTPISLDGKKVLWSVNGGAPGAPNGTENTFLAERMVDRWHSQSIAPPAEQQIGGGEFAYTLTAATPDFGTLIVNASRSTVGVPSSPNLLRVQPGREPRLLKAYASRPQLSYQAMLEVTDDGAHVVIPDVDTGQLEDIGGDKPEILSLMPDGLVSSCGLHLGTDNFNFGRGPLMQPAYHQIAIEDASRIYFQVSSDEDCNGPVGLYVRNRAANKGKGRTILIDPGASSGYPLFIRASRDGRTAYFLTDSNLDPLDLTEDANGGKPDLTPDADIYRWQESVGASSCLTCIVSNANVDNAGILVSNDFSRIYFQSKSRLIHSRGKDGDANLYVLSGGTLRFVGNVGSGSNTAPLAAAQGPQLSDDGKVLLFSSHVAPGLTADQVAPKCVNPTPGGDQPLGPCKELYRYDDSDGSMECISCRRGGLTTHSFGTPSGSGGEFAMSNDGATVAFATQQTLLRLDVNQDTDIYEWRNGAIRLITDGVSDALTNFTAPKVWAVDQAGDNIVFSTMARGRLLTGFERDGLLNLYVARIDGGFSPPSPSVHCSEDSCQGPLQPPPPAPRPASSAFFGHGNDRGGSKPKRRCARKRGKAKQRCKRRCARKRGKAKQRCIRKFKKRSRSVRARRDTGRAK